MESALSMEASRDQEIRMETSLANWRSRFTGRVSSPRPMAFCPASISENRCRSNGMIRKIMETVRPSTGANRPKM